MLSHPCFSKIHSESVTVDDDSGGIVDVFKLNSNRGLWEVDKRSDREGIEVENLK